MSGMTPPGTLPQRRTRPLVVALLVAIVVALIAAAVIVTLIVTRTSTPATTGASAAANVPVIANIAQPNAACTPAAGRKLKAGDDLSSILFFGYIDGQQKEMIVGNAMSQQIAGHKVEYVWYCPLRSQWH
jgi:hypothetical protein